MRIIQAIESSGPGGAEQMLRHLCQRLMARGHDVEALLLRPGWLLDQLREDGIPVSVVRSHGGAVDFDFLRRLRSLLADRAPDVLHTHEFTYALYGRLASWGKKPGQVATVHGKNFARGFKRRLVSATLLRPGGPLRLVAVSRDLGDELASRMLLPRTRIEVVANGVALPEGQSARARKPGEVLRLLAVGNLYPVKNHGLLIRAVAALRRRGIPAELEILGRGAEESPLRALIRELGVDNAVCLRGFRQDVEGFLAEAHVFVSSSLSEGMPVSFLEAMAHGLPVVASRVGGVEEIVSDGRNGLLFPSGDATAAVEALARLAADDAQRLALGRRGAELVRSHYAMSRTVDRYLELYRDVGDREQHPLEVAPPAPPTARSR